MTWTYNSIHLILGVIAVIVWGIGVYFRSRACLHIIQLEGYNNKNYSHWLIENKNKIYSKRLIGLLVATILLTVISIILSNTLVNFMIVLGVWFVVMILTIEFRKKPAKKELVFTDRAKRLFVSHTIVVLLIMSLATFLLGSYYAILLVIATLILFFIPNIMYVGNILVKPVEKRVHDYYFDMAYNKVRTFESMRIVGITGSYGKTSTKFITASILEEKFSVLKTPESYNTPMGISKVINNTLDDNYDAFVVEMGARKIGEIEEVARLANPKIGVVTAIGPTHMETQKTIENIMKTKYELIEQLPPDGIAIFNYDNAYVRKLADKTFKEKIQYGINDIEELDLYATDIQASETGSTFILKDKDNNSIKCTTKLLGEHNISNLLAGAAVGKALGLTFEEISRGIAKVEPVPHRLQLMNPGTGVVVIDDSFNSNPVSSKAALDVIAQFKEGKKVIVTPGMIELGDQEEEANRQFGRYIGEVCDYAILVGKNRTRPIYEGIIEKDFPEDKIIVVGNLEEATKAIQNIVKPKDVVLFENDLPDTYDE